MRAARAETLLNAIREAIREGATKHASTNALMSLAVEALREMAGDSFVITGPPLSPETVEEIKRRTGRTKLSINSVSDESGNEAGPIIASADGRQIWDNRFSERLHRLWPDLRRQIAKRTGLAP